MKKLLLIVLTALSLQASAQYTSILPAGYTPFATQMYYKIAAGDTTFIQGASGKGYHIIAATQAVKDSLVNYYTKTAADARFTPLTRSLTINGTAQDLSANRTFSVGTVTSVSALTLGATGTDLSSSVANGTTTPVITLNVPTASALNRGALSSTDWTTFNSKESALTFSTGLTRSANTITINQAFAPTWTGQHTFNTPIKSSGADLRDLGGLAPTGVVIDADYTVISNPKSRYTSWGNSLIRGGHEFRSVNGSGTDSRTSAYGNPDGDWLFYYNLNLPAQIASRVLVTDANKNIVSSSITTTTLNYLDATSSIQTQLNSKIGLSAISATSPIQYNSGTGVISITQSGASASGFLSTTDWNTFNNKASTATFSSYVPYTGATANVNIGAYSLLGTGANLKDINGIGVEINGDFTVPGQPKTIIKAVGQSTTRGAFSFDQVNGSSGDKITPLYIYPAGNAEFSYSVTASSFIKSGGTSVQYLMADGSTSGAISVPTVSGTTGYLPVFTGANAIGNSNWIQSGYMITPNNNSNQLVFSGNTTLIGSAIVLPGGSGTNADAPTIRMGNTGKTVATMQAQSGGVGIGFLAYASDHAGLGNIKRYGTIGIDGKWYIGNDDGSTVTYGSHKFTIASAGNIGIALRNGTSNDRFLFYVGDGTGGTVSDENYISNTNTDLNVLNTGGGVQLLNGATAWSAISDMRFKTKLSDIPNVLDGISKNAPFLGYYNANKAKKVSYMLSAQELQTTFPSVVDVGNDPDKTLSVKYTELIPVLFKAIQEQQVMINELSEKVKILEAK